MRVISTPQQSRGRGDKEIGSPLPEIVGEVGGNVMKIIHELNSRIYRLSEQTNVRQQEVLEELTSTLKEQMRGCKRSSDMVEDRVKGEKPVTIKFGELVKEGGEDNAHDILCWPVRKGWRMVPAETSAEDHSKIYISLISCRPFRTDFLQTVDRKMRKPCDENKMIEVLTSQKGKIAHI